MKRRDLMVVSKAITRYCEENFTGDRLAYGKSIAKHMMEIGAFEKVLSKFEDQWSNESLWDCVRKSVKNNPKYIKNILKNIYNQKIDIHDLHMKTQAELGESIPLDIFMDFYHTWLFEKARTYVRDIEPRMLKSKDELSEARQTYTFAADREKSFLMD
ncbi:MAG: hypothetical protein VZR53_09375 [Prevotella sp.]|nr:hypothetical protein [Prevotella sp.]